MAAREDRGSGEDESARQRAVLLENDAMTYLTNCIILEQWSAGSLAASVNQATAMFPNAKLASEVCGRSDDSRHESRIVSSFYAGGYGRFVTIVRRHFG